MKSEGLYRVSGFSEHIEDVRLAFDRGLLFYGSLCCHTCKNVHIHLHRHHFVLISPHQMATRPTSAPVPMRTSTSSPVLWNCTWETSPFPSLRSNCTLNSSKLRVRASLNGLFHAITALILTAGVMQGFQMPIPDWRLSTRVCSSCPPPTTRPCVTWWLTWRGQQNTLE